MYSDNEFSSFKNTLSASFILSNEVDFQTNSTVNLDASGGALVEVLSSRHISSSGVILTI